MRHASGVSWRGGCWSSARRACCARRRPTGMMCMTNKTAIVSDANDGWVAFVGAGPGDDGLLTLRGARLLGAARLIVAEAELAERLRHLFAADATLAEP